MEKHYPVKPSPFLQLPLRQQRQRIWHRIEEKTQNIQQQTKLTTNRAFIGFIRGLLSHRQTDSITAITSKYILFPATIIRFDR